MYPIAVQIDEGHLMNPEERSEAYLCYYGIEDLTSEDREEVFSKHRKNGVRYDDGHRLTQAIYEDEKSEPTSEELVPSYA